MQEGYTLLEMAIALIILGLFVGIAIPLYQIHRERMLFEETVAIQGDIDFALENFKAIRGRYPCPARYTAAPGDTDYGKETNCQAMTNAGGTCLNGLCFENSERTFSIDITNADGSVTPTNVTPRVIRGSIPFRTLMLEEEKSLDLYGGRFSYAVTQLLTDKETFRVNRGGISVVDGQVPTAQSLINPAASAHYFVFTHGPDGIGAYSRYGVQISPCNGPMYDNENCRTDATHTEARYRLSLPSRAEIVDVDGSIAAANPTAVAASNSHFDDIVDYISIGEQPLWESGEDADLRRTDTINPHNRVNGVIFMGRPSGGYTTNPADTTLKVEVTDTIRAGTADNPRNGQAQNLCARGAGVNCYPTSLLAAEAGDPVKTHLKCRPGTEGLAPEGVVNNQVSCITPTIALRCPAGEMMYGVGDGNIPLCRQYVAPARCDAEVVRLCNTNQNLPGNATVGTVHTVTAGASRSQPYTCTQDNSNPAIADWVAGAATGVCNCTPSTVTTRRGCGANMTGEIVEETTTTCPAGTTTTRQISNSCTCAPSSSTRTENCPPNFNGNVTYTTTVSCNGNTPVTTTTQTNNTCACVVNTQTRQINCPSGYTGQINQQRSSLCPSGGWGSWSETSNTCSCRAAYTQTRACPAGYNVGVITDRCTYNCTAGNTPANATCTEESRTCDCRAGEVTTTESCGYGYTGNVVVTTKTTCPGAVETTTRDRSACRPIVSTCTMRASNAVVGNSRVTWQDGDTCTYTVEENECSSVRFCYRVRGVGNYTTHNCSCQ